MTRFYRCKICGFSGELEPSPPLDDASCPDCGTLLFPHGSGGPDEGPSRSAPGRGRMGWVIGIIAVIALVVFWRSRSAPEPRFPAEFARMLNDPKIQEQMKEARQRAEAQMAMQKAFSHPRRLHALAEYTDLEDDRAAGAYLKGKVIVLFKPSAQAEDGSAARWRLAAMNYSLPVEVLATAPEEVGTVVLVREKRAKKCLAEVRVIDRSRPALVAVKTFLEEEAGAPPPEPAGTDSDLLSCDEIKDYLLDLPRRP